jgi:hypothetical protein
MVKKLKSSHKNKIKNKLSFFIHWQTTIKGQDVTCQLIAGLISLLLKDRTEQLFISIELIYWQYIEFMLLLAF